MKFLTIDETRVLFLEPFDYTESGISSDTVRNAMFRKFKNWHLVKDPDDNRVTLVGYEKLSDENKQKVRNRWGNPYDCIASEPIKKMLQHDDETEKLFLAYRYNGNQILHIKRVKQYTRAITWVKLLKEVREAKYQPIKKLGIRIPEFFKHVDALMQQEKRNGQNKEYEGREQLPGDFGSSQKRLEEKTDAYIKTGYTFIIDKMYGNQLAAKVSDEISEAKLLTYIEDPRQFDDVMVCMMYNLWAKENNYKIIGPATVGNWRRDHESEITMGRYGNNAMNEKFIRQVKGFRPSFPLALVEHDDNNLDFLFNSNDGYQFNKYVAIVVRDSNTDLVLGKSYRMAQSPVAEMVYHAYLDAMYYIRSLTGGWYLPFELKGDRWLISSLEPFYDKIGKWVKPAKGNKHRGYIEQSFGNDHWKRCQQLISEGNWTGNNMTAKNRGVNPDLLGVRVKQKLGPSVGEEAELQIENFFHMLRHMPDFKRDQMNAPSKEQKFLTLWETLTIEQKRPITDEQFLLTFGIKHNPQGRSITINNRGVEPQIGNQKYSYDLPESWMYNDLIGEAVNVYYDPFDFSRVLVTNGADIRFIAKTAQLTPRALADTYTGSRTFLNYLLSEKKDQVKKAAAASEKRKQLVGNSRLNPEAMLQGGVMIKEIKNQAEQAMIEQAANNYEQHLDDTYDFNDFFNT